MIVPFLRVYVKSILAILEVLDRHISRISRENGKWICETFLARNAAREIAGKSYQFLANLEPNLVKIWSFFQAKVTDFQLKSAIPFILHSF